MWPGSGKIDRVHHCLFRKGGREISFLSAAWVVWIWNNQQLSDPSQGNYLTKGHQAHLVSSIFSNIISDEFVKNLLSCTWLKFVVHLTSEILIVSDVPIYLHSFTGREQKSKERNIKKDKREATDNLWLISDSLYET